MRVVFAEGPAQYKCDYCKRNLSHEHADHITIAVGKRSGWVSERTGLPGFRIWRGLKKKRLHFCPASESECMHRFFVSLEGIGSAEYTEGERA